MPEILFLHKGNHAASTRYRALQYFDCLGEAGWTSREMKVSGSIAHYRAALQVARRADVVVVLKKPFTLVFRWLLRRAASRLVFDFDDAVYVRDSGADNARRLKQFQNMLAQCDDVWAGNEELLSTAANFAARHCLIPTTLAFARYQVKADKPDSTIDLVWIGGSASRPWLESILPILEKAASETPGLRLKIIADFTVQSKQLEVIEIPWSEGIEAQALASAHIGIAPLPDNAFTRGKCGLKTLQYMAAGLPVIATPTSVQSQMVQAGKNGFLADTEQDWLDAIRRLASDAGLREKMGLTGQAICIQHYSIETGCRKLLRRLNALIG